MIKGEGRREIGNRVYHYSRMGGASAVRRREYYVETNHL